MAQINPSLTALGNLLAAVNTANTGQTITTAQVTAGTANVQAADGEGRNTNVVLTAVANQGYTGTVTVSYIRLGLATSIASPNWNFAGSSGQTAASIISALATTNNLVATELQLENPTNNDVIAGPITNEPATLNLVSITGSLLYVDGSTETITFTWTVPLSTAVATTALEGFDVAS
jgi:hypothetical protein